MIINRRRVGGGAAVPGGQAVFNDAVGALVGGPRDGSRGGRDAACRHIGNNRRVGWHNPDAVGANSIEHVSRVQLGAEIIHTFVPALGCRFDWPLSALTNWVI